MLRELRIENIAIIEMAEIHFGEGLNVMTGETGAGKSIVLDAISAVTGGRVSRDLIRTGADHASVTAVFDSLPAKAWLESNGIDLEDDSLILHRRISGEGKGSARINGVPVTAGQLREVGALLLELHGQNDGLKLLDEHSHLEALDRFGALDLGEYRAAYALLCAKRQERDRLTMDEAEKQRLQESLRDTIEELDRASLTEGEYEELVSRRDLLRNSEKLTEAMNLALEALNADDGAISRQKDAEWNCRRAAAFSSELSDAAEKLGQAGFLLTDASETLLDYQQSMNFSPEEYDRIEERLRLLTRLERKYRKTLDELPDYLEECRRRLDEISFSEEHLKKLDQEIELAEKQCMTMALSLRKARTHAAGKLSETVEKELHDLSMPGARFRVELNAEPELRPDGLDSVRFLLAANSGEAPGRLSRIASGGELSRVMLALKNVFSRGDPVPTMVFDEIDTGVSGIAAQRVGEKLAGLSLRKQVLCVTHLPQLAAMADTHFLITKTSHAGRTFTQVSPLEREGRCRELARLHGGDNITETTLRSAEEQLEYALQFKHSINKS